MMLNNTISTEDLEIALDEIAAKLDTPDPRLSDIRLAIVAADREYWRAAALVGDEAASALAGRLASLEGLEKGTQEWVDRLMALEREARGEDVSEETTAA